MNNILIKYKQKIEDNFSSGLELQYDPVDQKEVQRFNREVNATFGKQPDKQLIEFAFYYSGIEFFDPFTNLLLFGLDEVLEESFFWHDHIEELNKGANLNFIVVGIHAKNLLIYRFDTEDYRIKYYEDIILAIEGEHIIAKTYEKLLQYIYDLYFTEEVEVQSDVFAPKKEEI